MKNILCWANVPLRRPTSFPIIMMFIHLHNRFSIQVANLSVLQKFAEYVLDLKSLLRNLENLSSANRLKRTPIFPKVYWTDSIQNKVDESAKIGGDVHTIFGILIIYFFQNRSLQLYSKKEDLVPNLYPEKKPARFSHVCWIHFRFDRFVQNLEGSFPGSRFDIKAIFVKCT